MNFLECYIVVFNVVVQWLMDHPKFYNNPLYIAGDSYSGIIVPIVVKEISDNKLVTLLNLTFCNHNEHVPPMNLKGYVLGNPVTDSEKNENSIVLFSYLNTLISDELYQSMKRNCKGDYINVDLNNSLCVSDLELYNECVKDINIVQILESSWAMPSLKSVRSKWYANDLSNKDSVNLLLSFPQLRRPWCWHYNYIFTYIWGNDTTVQDALRIQEGSIKEWVRCNETLQDLYISDVSSSLVYHENLIKQGYRVLIYSLSINIADHDMYIPYVGTMAWIESLNLTVDSCWKPWFIDGQVVGYRMQYSDKKYQLNFLIFQGAGHTAPQYKPEECHAMIIRRGTPEYDPLVPWLTGAKKRSNACLEPHELLEPSMLHSWLLELDDPIKIGPPTTMIVALIGQTKTVPKPLTMKTAVLDLPKIGLIAFTVMTMIISSIHVGSFMGIQKVIHATSRRKFVVVHLQIMFQKAQPRMRCTLLCSAFWIINFRKCWLS
ncbi:unnamed protein product [Prunus brigantina]